VTLSVSLALALPISLDGFRVGLSVLPGIIGVPAAPFLLAIPADLTVQGIGFNLAAVIIPATMPLTIQPPTNDLVRMETGRLEQLLAVMAAAVAHRSAPDRDASRSL